jgi:2-dehydro-3-deoxygalactonokinase
MIGVDWGTTRFRAFRIDGDGVIAERHEAARGIMSVAPGEFPAVLRAAIAPWLADGERHVLMSGMVGSRQGWVEAPYLPCPAGPEAIAAALVAVPFDGARVLLVPGLSDTDETGVPEVMRGEETQIVGALAELPGEAVVCLPGSHAKWARVAAGKIVAYRTYLSGEAFAAIRGGTILGRMMREAPPSPAAFARGVARAGDAGHLLHHLFGVRALGLAGRLGDDESASYLSGLLIGHEIRAAMGGAGIVHLIGETLLTGLYADAITTLGAEVRVIDGDVAASGLALIGAHAPWS